MAINNYLKLKIELQFRKLKEEIFFCLFNLFHKINGGGGEGREGQGMKKIFSQCINPKCIEEKKNCVRSDMIYFVLRSI